MFYASLTILFTFLFYGRRERIILGHTLKSQDWSHRVWHFESGFLNSRFSHAVAWLGQILTCLWKSECDFLRKFTCLSKLLRFSTVDLEASCGGGATGSCPAHWRIFSSLLTRTHQTPLTPSAHCPRLTANGLTDAPWGTEPTTGCES